MYKKCVKDNTKNEFSKNVIIEIIQRAHENSSW